MGILLGDMVVRFTADITSLTAGAAAAKGEMGSFSSSAGAVGGVMAAGLALGVTAIVGVGVASAVAATEFQKNMLKVQAYAGLTKQQTTDMGNSIMDMGSKYGVGPTELAKAIYPIISSGYDAAQSLNILKLSAMTAGASGAQTSVVADALTTSLKAMHAPASQASNYMDMFNKVVQLGKGEVPAYAAVIGKLSLAAGSAKVPFGDMGAALATLTTHGFPSVAQAATSLGNLFTQVGPKVDAVAQHAQKMGIAFDENKFKTDDLSQKIAYLNQVTGGNQGEILKLLGGSATALKAFNALSGSTKDFTANLDSMGKSQGMTQKVFDTTSQGFGAAMDRMKAAGEGLLIKIGQQLLPNLTKLANQVVPIITQFANWLTSGNRLQNFINGLVGAITNVATWIGNFVKELQTNRPMLDAFIVVIGALAGIIGGLMVAALVAMAIAAWAAIAPLLPFILIGAAIGAVIALVIVIFMHWGEIAHWLQGIWGAFVGWLQGIWGGLGAWFQGILGSIEAFWKQKWKQITDAVGEAIAIIQTVIRVGFSILIDIVFGPIIAIVGFFQWLYNHNYYFKDLVDKIKEIFTGAFTWLKDQWNRFTGWLGGIWDGIKGKASDAWGSITDTVKGKTTDAGNALHTGWTNTSTTLSTQWNNFSKFMEKAWQLVMDVLNIIWTKFIGPPLTKLWNQFSTWFGNLAGQAVTWGQNLIQGFINGIQGMFGNVTSTVQNLMGNVASFLGFHSPAEKGPGKELDIWGPNLVKGFAAGVDKSSPILAASLTHLIQYPGGLSGASAGGSASSGAGGGQTIIIELDSKQLARTVMTSADKMVRLKVGSKSTRAA